MTYILERLKEPSTWRGILAMVTAVSVKLHPEMQEAIISAGLALIGMVNIFREEKKLTLTEVAKKAKKKKVDAFYNLLCLQKDGTVNL